MLEKTTCQKICQKEPRLSGGRSGQATRVACRLSQFRQEHAAIPITGKGNAVDRRYMRWALAPLPNPACWARRYNKIEERQRRAWERFQEEERQEEEAAQRKAAQEAYNEEKRQRIAEGKRRREAEEERRKQIREAKRERKKKRAAQAEAVEKCGDTTGKWPRWTQD
jgi:hypothetical protein